MICCEWMLRLSAPDRSLRLGERRHPNADSSTCLGLLGSGYEAISVPMPDSTTQTLRVNGEDLEVVFPTHHSLLEVLREACGLTGTKHGCELGECGTCMVLVDGSPVLSCLVLAAEVGEADIETVEGLQVGGALHPLQATFADLGAAQCGYCTPGMLMTAKALLAENPEPTREEITMALAGNLCRCTGYHKIVEAVEWAAALARGDTDFVPSREAIYGAALPEDI